MFHRFIPRRSRFLVAVSVLLLASLAFRWATSPSSDAPMEGLFFAVCLALWVPIGLALLAAGGLTEERAALSTLLALVALGVACIGYFLTGFAFHFGGIGLVDRSPTLSQLIWEWSPLDKSWGLGWGVIGLRGFLLGSDASDPQAYQLFLSQLAPLSIAVLAPLLALRGRMKPLALIVSAALVSMVTYPIVGNWIWGGGWLGNLGLNVGFGHGFLDFAGAGTVHLVAGSTALAGLVVFLKPQPTRMNDLPAPMPPIHLPMLALLGSFLLIPGWLGLAFSNSRVVADVPWPVVGVNFVLAAAAAAFLALLYSWFTTGAANIFMTARGLVCGLVAISAAAPFVPAWSALVIGAFAGLLLPPVAYFVMYVLGLDDRPLIVPIHGVSAVWGLIAAALFADGRYGVGWNGVGAKTYLGIGGQGVTGYLASAGAQPDFPQQMYAQLIGILAIFVFVFVTSWVAFQLMSKLTAAWEGPGIEPATAPVAGQPLSIPMPTPAADNPPASGQSAISPPHE